MINEIQPEQGKSKQDVSPTLSTITSWQDDLGLTSSQVLRCRSRQLSVQTSVFFQEPKVKGSEIYFTYLLFLTKDGQLTIFTCAVFITAKNLFFDTKMVNVL